MGQTGKTSDNHNLASQTRGRLTQRKRVSFFMELWKEIPGTHGLYFVSDRGNVKSLCGRSPRILKQRNHRVKRKCGDMFYKSVALRVNGKYHHKLVHRLVAEAFIPNPEGRPIINHIDENPTNNKAANLEWCSYHYNTTYGGAQERRLASRGEGRLHDETM